MTDKKPKRPPRTIKEKRWLRRTIELGDGGKAAMEVYNVNGNASARAIASQNFSRLAIDDALKAEGLTDHHAAVKIKEGMDSMKIHGTNASFIEISDMATRHKYLETYLRLGVKGYGTNSFNVNIDNRKQYYVALPERKK